MGVRRSGGSGDLRHGNLTQILRYVRHHGPSSRHDIAHGCGLGISTMTDLVGELRSRRLVRELEPVRRPGAGRPTRPIALDGDPWWVLGIHIDVDHVRFSAATVGATELWSETVDADLRNPGTEGLAVFDEMLRAQLSRSSGNRDLVAIEVGLPGYVGRDRGTVGWSAQLDWHDVPLDTLIGATLRDLDLPHVHIGVSNDCQLAALYAVRCELALPTNSVAVYLGGARAMGSAIIIDGEIFRGANGGAGDLAHKNVDPTGPADWCGRRGCLESMAGPRRLLVGGLLRTHAEADLLVRERPREVVRVLREAAEAGDRNLLAELERAGIALGRAVDDIIGMVNPQTVVLGGYLGELGEYLLPSIQAVIADRVNIAAFAETVITPLQPSQPRVVAGATLAARDVCLYDPLSLTRPLVAFPTS